MVARDDLLRDLLFLFHRVCAGVRRRFTESGVARVHWDQRVGHRHELAELYLRRFGHADVVTERLAHLLHAVQPDEQRHHRAYLRRLAELALVMTSHEQIEELVDAAEFDVGLRHDRIVGHRHRVEQLVQ